MLVLALSLLLACGAEARVRHHLVTYATESHHAAAHRLAKSALDVGGFDEAHVYGPDTLDDAYRLRNARILNQPRGAGYWIYKPYVVLRYMHEVADANDVVCYMDSLYEFKQPFTLQVDEWLASSPVALTVNKPDERAFYEKSWSKRDAFLIMGVDEATFRESLQAWCGFICFRNTFEAVQYVAAWLTYTQDARVVTDSPTQLAGGETRDFVENRHDQTVCSLLAKAFNVTMQHFPSGPVFNHHLYG
jgi:hypothetical protein